MNAPRHPRIDGPEAALRWLRLLGQALTSALHWAAFHALPRRATTPLKAPSDSVILVTLDGVRPRELLSGADPTRSADTRATCMPHLMRTLLPQGTFIGSDSRRPDFRIGSPIGVSMAGYHSIFAGRLTLCFENEVPPPRGSTLVTHIQQSFPNDPCPVALLSTWDLIVDCTKADASRADLVRGRSDALILRPELAETPTDEPVFQVAMDRLKRDPPKFLYIGFDETDDAGHRNDYARHMTVLERFDGYLKAITDEMQRLSGIGHRTTLIVTTDHGRGFGDEWVEHRWNIDGTARAWLFAMGHGIAKNGKVSPSKQRSHYDIRPTIEHLLGLPQGRRFWRGDVIAELLRDP